MTVTPVQTALDELDALLAVATPGPWDLGPNWTGGWAVARALIEDPDGTPVFHPSGWTADDAALIVALRNTAPAMLAAIRTAYGVAEKLDRVAAVGEPSRGIYDDGIRASSHFAATSLRAALDEALGVAK